MRKRREQLRRNKIPGVAQPEQQFQFDPLSEMLWAREQAQLIYEEAKQEENVAAQLLILAEMKKQDKFIAELQERIKPELAEKLEKEWPVVRDVVFSALEPYPEVRIELTRKLLAFKNNPNYRSDRQLLPDDLMELEYGPRTGREKMRGNGRSGSKNRPSVRPHQNYRPDGNWSVMQSKV